MPLELNQLEYILTLDDEHLYWLFLQINGSYTPYVYRMKCVIESVTDLPLKPFEAIVQLDHLYFSVATHYRAT